MIVWFAIAVFPLVSYAIKLKIRTGKTELEHRMLAAAIAIANKRKWCFDMRHDPVTTYTRIIEDLERIAAAIPPERLDPCLWYEIKEAKEELARLQAGSGDNNIVP
jgi:hypothetical protein